MRTYSPIEINAGAVSNNLWYWFSRCAPTNRMPGTGKIVNASVMSANNFHAFQADVAPLPKKQGRVASNGWVQHWKCLICFRAMKCVGGIYSDVLDIFSLDQINPDSAADRYKAFVSYKRVLIMTRTSDYPLRRRKSDCTLCSTPFEHVQLSLCQLLCGRISTLLIWGNRKFACQEGKEFFLVGIV